MSGQSRRYELKRSESPAAGIERIALGRIDHALDQLRNEGAATFAESVHEARKDLKKLRSLLRLVRGAIDDSIYGRENDRFRDVGHLLAGARDAEVKLATIDALGKGRGGLRVDGDLQAYRRELEAERDAHSRSSPGGGAFTERAAAELETGRAAVREWCPNGDGWETVAAGFDRGYRRGRNRFRDTREHPSAENVHEWRKRVKDLWYHLRILKGMWPTLIGETAEGAHELSDLLGDHHDLALLAADARGRQGLIDDDATLQSLLTASERRQGKLLSRALSVGARIYAERPRAFVSRYAAYWSAWRAG